MQCAVYLCRHERAGAWTLLLPTTDPIPKSWPDVTIRCVGYFESEVEGYFESEVEAAAAARGHMAADRCEHT
jgi:hypothetical protein